MHTLVCTHTETEIEMHAYTNVHTGTHRDA